MNAKRLFEDDDFLFADPSTDRASHVELRVDGNAEPAPTQPEIVAAEDYLRRVPRLAVGVHELALLPLDHREGFLVSRVDGKSTIETLLDVCAMPADEALEILQSLVERGVLLVPPAPR
jgi:hypothetical protein